MTKYRRVWLGSAISGFVAPALFLLGLGFGLGRLVDEAATGGVPYVAFVAPGVLAATAVQVAAGETSFSVVGAIKWRRVYDGMLATPLRVGDLVAGHLAYALVRVGTAAAAFLLVAALLGTPRSPWAPAAVPVAVLGGLAFGAACYAYSASLRGDGGLAALFRFVVTPMTLFSGTFFPVGALPGWMQPLVWATPLPHAVAAARALWLGAVEPAAFAGHLLYLVAWLVVGGLLARRVLRGRMVV
jgi:lipooligosaccharide transport system permease protein